MFETLFYQPVLNLLVFLYNIVPGNDLGIAIVLLTIIIKVLLFPLSKKSIKSQKELQELQPKIKEIKEKYKNNKEELGRETMKLYKENNVNPFSSCLPLLIQLPFLFAVFRVFRNGFENGSLDLVYAFIANPGTINQISLGFLNLSEPNIYLAILAGLAQYWQAKMMMSTRATPKVDGSKDEDMMAIMNKQMIYMMPVLTIFIGITLPGGLTFYWLITTLLTGFQQLYVFKDKKEGNTEVVK